MCLGKKAIDKEFLIWFAGFWEGEGCLSIDHHTTGNPRRVSIFVGQAGDKGKKICEEIQSKLGGKVRLHQRRKENWKECYVWEINSRDKVIEIVEMMLPYLRFRKDEVEEKLKILKKWRDNGRKNWTQEEIELLKRLGHLPATQLTKYFPNHTYNSIKQKKTKLGLKYDRKYRKKSK